jgi:hypothetical protein
MRIGSCLVDKAELDKDVENSKIKKRDIASEQYPQSWERELSI